MKPINEIPTTTGNGYAATTHGDALNIEEEERAFLFQEEGAESVEPTKSNDDRNHSFVSLLKSAISVYLRPLSRYVLLIGNIGAWYITNGMNGIAMQSFATDVRHTSSGDNEEGSTTTIPMVDTILTITVSVTALQLLLGALLGIVMLSIRQGSLLISPLSMLLVNDRRWTSILLPILHSLGSIATNLGFMYGSASLIQIIKLLEPFETLILTRLLLPDEGKMMTLGVVSSMTLTIGGALSLITARSTPPHPCAVVFALASGLSLSSRNVLQRRQHTDDQQGRQQQHSQLKDTIVVPDKTDDASSKLERALVQFTKMSLQAGLLLGALAIPLNLIFVIRHGHDKSIILALVRRALHWPVLTWHPLYNAFSMIALGFVSALTHSLLNAGKRVFAIVMAVLWFHENFTSSTAFSLLLVTLGGCWYTVESKNISRQASSRSWLKPTVTLMLLGLYYSI